MKTNFTGRAIPFGSIIDYNPPPTTQEHDEKGKFETRTGPVSFLGYELQAKGIWKGHYRTSPLNAIKEIPLLHGTTGIGLKLKDHITYTENIMDPALDVTMFPLKADSDWANRTIEGRRHHITRQILMEYERIDQEEGVDRDSLELRQPVDGEQLERSTEDAEEHPDDVAEPERPAGEEALAPVQSESEERPTLVRSDQPCELDPIAEEETNDLVPRPADTPVTTGEVTTHEADRQAQPPPEHARKESTLPAEASPSTPTVADGPVMPPRAAEQAPYIGPSAGSANDHIAAAELPRPEVRQPKAEESRTRFRIGEADAYRGSTSPTH